MPNVVLGVSGSVAAYRAADLARDLMRGGFTVRACLTDSAQKFVLPALFEALTGEPCLTDTFGEPVAGHMAHIDWARAADVLLVAPATANVLNKLAGGIADDMLSTIALAYDGPIVLAPAMNPKMYAHETVREAIAKLAARGAAIVQPSDGDVACGEHGQGKLAANSQIVESTLAAARKSALFAGKRILITSGPTREAIDDVRFLTSRSSGKMGAALARAALSMGASVDVVTGPTAEPLPPGANVVRVESASEMLAAALRLCEGVDLAIAAAAVADYRPEAKVDGKIRRGAEQMDLRLVKNPDISAEIARRSKAPTIGFAAEPSASLDSAAEKLKAKGLVAIAANDVSRSDVGFDSDDNELTLVLADGSCEASGKLSKLGCAWWLLERAARFLKT